MSASIELRCECQIPFQAELLNFIQRLASGAIDENFDLNDVPHKDIIVQAIRSKIIFIKFRFARSLKKVKPRLLAALRKTFQKELIGTIKQGQDEITFILL